MLQNSVSRIIIYAIIGLHWRKYPWGLAFVRSFVHKLNTDLRPSMPNSSNTGSSTSEVNVYRNS
ncbi:hypothetical protein T11_9444 [Trichinella zimbabwensis]|uniref:Uncharacterized protein n=1 Tax=Trichinella zimbabwensis TaxID=268475 RepID=A0A0V1HAD1_9BILA|nr:hypothetical protein T11_9444 [Trichinella zimbabwensis]